MLRHPQQADLTYKSLKLETVQMAISNRMNYSFVVCCLNRRSHKHEMSNAQLHRPSDRQSCKQHVWLRERSHTGKCGLWIHLHKLWKAPSQCELVFTCDSWGGKGCRRARGLWRCLLCSDTWFLENSSWVGLCTLSICSWHLNKGIKDQCFSTCEVVRGKTRGRGREPGWATIWPERNRPPAGKNCGSFYSPGLNEGEKGFLEWSSVHTGFGTIPDPSAHACPGSCCSDVLSWPFPLGEGLASPTCTQPTPFTFMTHFLQRAIQHPPFKITSHQAHTTILTLSSLGKLA